MPEIGEEKDRQRCSGTVGNPGVKADEGNR